MRTEAFAASVLCLREVHGDDETAALRRRLATTHDWGGSAHPRSAASGLLTFVARSWIAGRRVAIVPGHALASTVVGALDGQPASEVIISIHNFGLTNDEVKQIRREDPAILRKDLSRVAEGARRA